MKNLCPVCGFDGLLEAAYDELNFGSYEICPCCQFHFDVDDEIELLNGEMMEREETHRRYRDHWIQEGAPIFLTKHYPIRGQEDGKVKRERLVHQLTNVHVFFC